MCKKLLCIAGFVLIGALNGQLGPPSAGFSVDPRGKPIPGLTLDLSSPKDRFTRGENVIVKLLRQNKSGRSIARVYLQNSYPFQVAVERLAKAGWPFFDSVNKTPEGKRLLDNPQGKNFRKSGSLVGTPSGTSSTVEVCLSCLYDLSEPGTYRARVAELFETNVKGAQHRVVSNEIYITIVP